MDEISYTQLVHAAQDATTLDTVVNGSATRSNPGHADGTVTSRTGLVIKTLSKATLESAPIPMSPLSESLQFADTPSAWRTAINAPSAGEIFYIDDYIDAAAQVPGVGDNAVPMLQAHLDWCAAGASATLIYTSKNYNTSVTLPLPDNYLWSLYCPGWATVTQLTPNTPLFLATLSESRGLFNIEGFRCQWGTLQDDGSIVLRPAVVYAGTVDTAYQATGETLSIALCFTADPTAVANTTVPGKNPLYNGVFQWTLRRFYIENGYRGISKHPDADTIYPLSFTLWGFVFQTISSGQTHHGALLNIDSTQGGPFCIIDNMYGGSADAVEPWVHLKSLTGLRGRNWEVNNGTNSALVIDACIDVDISIRFENHHLTVDDASIVTINGGMTNANVVCDFTSMHISEGVTRCFGLIAYGGCHVNFAVAHNLGVGNSTGFILAKATPSDNYISTIQLTQCPKYRFEGAVIDAYTYMEADAPNIRFPNTSTFNWFYAGITAGLFSDLNTDGSPNTATGATRCSNGMPGGSYVMTTDGFITNLYARTSTPVTAGLMYIQLWKTKGGVSTAVDQFYTYHFPDAENRQNKYAIIPFDPVISGHVFYKGDELHVTVSTTAVAFGAAADFAPAGMDIVISATVSYLHGTREIPIPTLVALQVDDYTANTGSWSANIIGKTIGSTLSMVNTIGGKFSVAGSGEAWTLVGTGLVSGSFVPAIAETLVDAVGDPKHSYFGITVA